MVLAEFKKETMMDTFGKVPTRDSLELMTFQVSVMY